MPSDACSQFLRRSAPRFATWGRPARDKVTKLANNMLAAAQMAALAEAVAFAQAEHLDPRRMYDVISGASGDSSVLQQRFPASGVLAHAPASNDWAAFSPVDPMIKDVVLALDAAAAHGLKLPVITAAEEQYRAAHDAGWGELDYSTIARLRFD
jgi:3-hydroxyisobutyrate dehydrogenase-like beta-hydroxyacid dehydrogenase